MLLIINSGSSSLKLALHANDLDSAQTVRAGIDRLDGRGGAWEIDAENIAPGAIAGTYHDHASALGGFLDWLANQEAFGELDGAGHRLVHGGPLYTEPTVIDDAMLGDLAELTPFSPGHLPQAIACIRALRERAPALVQIACFDTAFHHTMPAVAKQVPIPRHLWEHGIARYGFHGLSYESIWQALKARDPQAATRRTIIAHLGNGASMVAIRHGQAIDTTMGLTPAGGLMMGTRPGDLDPGILLYLARQLEMDIGALDHLVNHESGLLGVSGVSSDMRDLQTASPTCGPALEAIELYCYLAKKQLGGLLAALGGVDRLVFTGGIGQHAPSVRHGICAGLEDLGIRIHAARNIANETVISADGCAVEVLVLPTDEEQVIARHTARLLKEMSGSAS